MVSSAERAIRDDLVAWWHENYPDARVVHELPLSSFSAAGRADLGVISSTEIILVEIKSEKDRLHKLETQYQAMSRRAHWFQCVLHDKWFGEPNEWGEPCIKGQNWLPPHEARNNCWSWPSREFGWNWNKASMSLPGEGLPAAALLLEMLHADELRSGFQFYPIPGPRSRATREDLIRHLTAFLTGSQVREMVCRALRARRFAEADPAICDELGPKQPDLLEVRCGS